MSRQAVKLAHARSWYGAKSLAKSVPVEPHPWRSISTWSGVSVLPLCSPFTLFSLHTPPSALTCLCWAQAAQQKEWEHSGTWTSHLFTTGWTGAWQKRGDAPVIGCASSTLGVIGLERVGLKLGGNSWLLSQSAAKGRQTARDRGPATMAFLSNYLKWEV